MNMHIQTSKMHTHNHTHRHKYTHTSMETEPAIFKITCTGTHIHTSMETNENYPAMAQRLCIPKVLQVYSTRAKGGIEKSG